MQEMLALQASKRISIWLMDNFRHVSPSFSGMSSPKCSNYWGLNNNPGHISLQSSWAVSFTRRLVQDCFCRRWSQPGVSWPHVKVRLFLDLFFQPCDHILMLTFPVAPGFVTTYGGLVTLRAFLGLVEGPLTPGIFLLLSSFYTRKELSFRYVAGLQFWRRIIPLFII